MLGLIWSIDAVWLVRGSLWIPWAAAESYVPVFWTLDNLVQHRQDGMELIFLEQPPCVVAIAWPFPREWPS